VKVRNISQHRAGLETAKGTEPDLGEGGHDWRSGRRSEVGVLLRAGRNVNRGDLRPEAQPCRPSGYQIEHREASAADIQHQRLLGGDGGDTEEASCTNIRIQASEAAKFRNPATTIPRLSQGSKFSGRGAIK